MGILFKGLIFAVFLIALRFLAKAFSSGKDELEEDKKKQYLKDKFMSLKNTIDKSWESEIIDIIISPPFLKNRYWTVIKCINLDGASGAEYTGDWESFEIYRKTDEELVLEMNQPKESVTEIVDWTCNECNEDNESSFDSCWKCQTLKQ